MSLSLEKWIYQIDSQYILILLDDHIIKNFSITSLESIIKDVKKNKILYAPLISDKYSEKYIKYKKIYKR